MLVNGFLVWMKRDEVLAHQKEKGRMKYRERGERGERELIPTVNLLC